MFVSRNGLYTALLTTILPLLVQGCIRFSGQGDVGLGGGAGFTVTDNDVKTCEGHGANQDSATCNDGYTFSWNWGRITDPIPVTYTTPAGMVTSAAAALFHALAGNAHGPMPILAVLHSSLPTPEVVHELAHAGPQLVGIVIFGRRIPSSTMQEYFMYGKLAGLNALPADGLLGPFGSLHCLSVTLTFTTLLSGGFHH
ncbi:hypothetical protein FH972_021579 [Carpinus fangiana]|uniref:Glycoside hydrolase family 3 C-terminal domain-containing protein n=1 Tax=Carpinus fangiana TaxID=176857 RepID=A0A5N6KPQ1_9ROSI|nr:hypothetical protein FH972_021579 [Carpinus fangiana]